MIADHHADRIVAVLHHQLLRAAIRDIRAAAIEGDHASKELNQLDPDKPAQSPDQGKPGTRFRKGAGMDLPVEGATEGTTA